MRFVPQVSPFRVGVRYNNMGMILAGEILESISRKSWSEFVRERVLKPLEMTATVPDVLELAGVENVATPYVDVDGRLLVDGPLQEDRTWALPLPARRGATGRRSGRPGRSARRRTTWRSSRSSSWPRVNSMAAGS